MTFGTKEGSTIVGKKVKVTYHCHTELENIPREVKEIWRDDLTIDQITWDSDNGLWRIDYHEIV